MKLDKSTSLKKKSTLQIQKKWGAIPLSNITEPITKGTTPSTEGKSFKKKGILFFKAETFDDNGNIDYNKFAFIDEKTHKKLSRSQLQENDILFTIAGTLGRVCKVKKQFLPSNTNQAIAIIRLKDSSCDSGFLEYFLRSDYIKKEIQAEKTIAAQPNLNLKQVSNLKILKPQFSEQQKIGSILSNFSNTIEFTKGVIEKNKKIKNGLIQKLLTEGISHSKFRKVQSNFEQFEKIPESWKMKPLSKIGKILGGGTPKTSVKEYWDGSVAWACPTDITNLQTNFIKKTERNITQKGLENSSANKLPSGTILLTSRATVGECAINVVPMATNQGFQNIRCNKNNYNLFWLYAIQHNKIKLIRFAHGTTFLEISKKNLARVKIASPDFPEQQEIAKILSSIDSLIHAEEDYLKKLFLVRKGLATDLFNEKVRVNVKNQ